MDAGRIEALRGLWHPIASSDDLPFRHVFHGQLLGQELAVWRADDGNVNVWENRCLHRGVRLSIGINEGAELKCQYHGWRYANRTAGCTYIPAHPADAPARRIANRTYPVREADGLVWTRLDGMDGEGPSAGSAQVLALRPIPVNAPPEAVLAGLIEAGATPRMFDRLGLLGARIVLDGVALRFFVQPVDAGRAVIRGLADAPEGAPLDLLRRLDARLEALREEIEAEAAREPVPEPIIPIFEPVSVDLVTMPDLVVGRQATLRARLKRRWDIGIDCVGLELEGLAGLLPTFQPGAHIDLHLPNGLVRQYSIINGPGEQSSYVIGVKRETNSRGGSVGIHETLRVGDVVAISEPRNNFPLRRDATHTILVAGGIGVTPMLAMARALARQRLSYEMHVFARSAEHLPFAVELAALGEPVRLHLGLDPAETGDALAAIAASPGFARHLYICGPGPMLERARELAATAGWADEAVHFEYFRNDRPIDDSSGFIVDLARSALTLDVPAGRSLLEVLRENGVAAASSCEQGACGTCLTRVLEGVPEHQDVYLNESEKRSNTVMLTCVSRARTPRLVLDI
jgi:ferredoxin-NADP reductase/nitrite reductase/ring-hydroxylating ferredoxin subunit